MSRELSLMCPAHRCMPGSRILGVRGNDGKVTILPQTLKIDLAFVKQTRQHHMPAERRFRFTNKCIKGGCGQWNGGGCNVAEKVVGLLEEMAVDTWIPNCDIRSRCRWFVQKGKAACRICSYVSTEVIMNEVHQRDE